MFTPLSRSGEIDDRATACLIEYQIEAGVEGLFVLGSTGEGDSLPFATQYRFAERVVRYTDGRVPLFLGALQSGTEPVIEFVNQCRCRDAFAAIVVGVPYYRFLHSEAEVMEHFGRVYEATGKPVVVYNLPHPASRVLTPEVSLKLAEHEGVIGFKDSSGQSDCLHALIAHGARQSSFRVYEGAPERSLESLSLGCDGLIPGPGNFIPWLFVELYQAYRAGDLDTADAHQQQINAFRQFSRQANPYNNGVFHYSTFKAGLDVMGFGGGTPSPPYRRLPDADHERLRPYFEAAGVLERTAPISTRSPRRSPRPAGIVTIAKPPSLATHRHEAEVAE